MVNPILNTHKNIFKADMQTEYKASLEQLLWFVNCHLENTGVGNFENEYVEFIFNTDMPMDEGATIDNIRNSTGILSTETLIANHPWVDSPQKELEKLKKEKQEDIDQYNEAFEGITPNDDKKGDE